MLTPEQLSVANERIERANRFLTELRDGTALADAARHAGYDYPFARRMASCILGWEPAWRRPSPYAKHDIAAIVLTRAGGATLAEIGGQLGVTRQRVEQILQEHGIDSGALTGEIRRKRMERRTEERRLRRQHILKAREERAKARYANHIRLWGEGITIRGIAMQMGEDRNTTATNICRLRKKYGWFPKRRPECRRTE